jgi:hypothetical protein
MPNVFQQRAFELLKADAPFWQTIVPSKRNGKK